jgi:hypothetical protein
MNYPFVFVDEVGFSDDPNQPFIAIGLFKVFQPDLLLEDLHKHHFDYSTENKQKRREIIDQLVAHPKALSMDEYNSIFLSTRHHEFKFENITYPSLERYKELVDILVQYPIDFSCLIVDKSHYPLNQFDHFWQAYSHYLHFILKESYKDNEKYIIIADWVNRPKENSHTLHEHISPLPHVVNVLQADSQSFLLLQMCDLLMGTMIFEKKYDLNLFVESNKLKARLEFVKHFKKKLSENKNITINILNYANTSDR